MPQYRLESIALYHLWSVHFRLNSNGFGDVHNCATRPSRGAKMAARITYGAVRARKFRRASLIPGAYW